jgi:Domain of unknown function (DUF5606)
MELKELASISGKGGLYKVVKPGKSGMILEALDETKSRLVANPNMKISLLDEISLYTRTKEGTASLGDVLKKIHKEFPGELGVDGNSDPSELRAFLKSVLPEFDEERVYPSDIRKLIRWFEIIRKAAPEILQAAPTKD